MSAPSIVDQKDDQTLPGSMAGIGEATAGTNGQAFVSELALLSVTSRHDEEDRAESNIRKAAEPLIQNLKSGENRFGEKEFIALGRYFLEGPARRVAKARGRFSIGPVRIIKEKG
jgi:hypothetical protein